MFGRSITTITACALGASALILPPGVAPASDKDVSFPVIANPKHQSVTFPCPSCAFSSSKETSEKTEKATDDLFWIQGGANSIMVNFTVSLDGRNLEMGGSSIYPAASALPKVHQVSSSLSALEIESGDATTVPLELTSFNVAFVPSRMMGQDGGFVTVLRVFDMSLEGQSLPLPELVVTMLEMADGELLILDAESAAGHHIKAPHHGPPMHHPEDRLFPRPDGFGPHGKGMHIECGMLPGPLCKLKHTIEAKIFGLSKGGRTSCHGRKGKHTNPWMGKDGHVRLPTHIKGHRPHVDFEMHDSDERPHRDGHRGHDGHHGHHHGHGFFHAFVKGFIAVLIPVMAGVTVGMAVSFVGLAFGRLITFIWVNFVRGGRRGYASVALTESAAETGQMKVADVDETDAPPMYEDAPKYEVVEKLEVKEENWSGNVA